MTRLRSCLVLLRRLALGGRALAQTPQVGKVIVTVVDPTQGVLPSATVTLTGLDDATKGKTIAPVKANDKGVATFEGVTPGPLHDSRRVPRSRGRMVARHSCEDRRQQARDRAAAASTMHRLGDRRPRQAGGGRGSRHHVRHGADARADRRAVGRSGRDGAQLQDMAGPGAIDSRRQLRGRSSCRRRRRSSRSTSRAISSRPRTTRRRHCSSTSSRSPASARSRTSMRAAST